MWFSCFIKLKLITLHRFINSHLIKRLFCLGRLARIDQFAGQALLSFQRLSKDLPGRHRTAKRHRKPQVAPASDKEDCREKPQGHAKWTLLANCPMHIHANAELLSRLTKKVLSATNMAPSRSSLAGNGSCIAIDIVFNPTQSSPNSRKYFLMPPFLWFPWFLCAFIRDQPVIPL